VDRPRAGRHSSGVCRKRHGTLSSRCVLLLGYDVRPHHLRYCVMTSVESSPVGSPFLQAAIEASEKAAALIRKAYRGNFDVEYKADASPVTAVDVASERLIRAHLMQCFPSHGFFGEELGQQNLDAEYLWLIDPIDGTKSFVRGYPMFSVQIALMHKGALIVGVSNAPCWNGGAGEIAFAERGAGAWLGGERLTVSVVDALKNTTLSTGNVATLARSPRWADFGALIPQLHRIRGYGDFMHYHLLAAGRIDAIIESDVNILDIAALSVIVTEAGGTFTDLCGRPLSLDTTTVLATNGLLHPLLAHLAL
jgi:histidinol-phosphatase